MSFGLIRACRSGLVLYSIVLSHAGGENDGSSAISERLLLASIDLILFEPVEQKQASFCVVFTTAQSLPIHFINYRHTSVDLKAISVTGMVKNVSASKLEKSCLNHILRSAIFMLNIYRNVSCFRITTL